MAPLEVSSSQVTIGIVPLSASSVTTKGSGAVTSPKHCTEIGNGLDAVGKIASPEAEIVTGVDKEQPVPLSSTKRSS